jgi:hypothetical protein
MQLPFTILASGDSWIGLLIFIIIAIASSVGKKMQKEQEPELPEQWPQPLPPQHRPPVITQRPAAPRPQQSRRSLTEEQVQEVLRRMRRHAQSQVPPRVPPVVETVEEAPRRLVKLSREESELPSARPEAEGHEHEPPPAPPEPAQPEDAPTAALAPKLAVATSGISPRASLYRGQLRSRQEIRRAIVLRELLGPPLALRQDW